MPKPRQSRAGTREERVDLRFLESVRRRTPHHPELLKALGDLYTRTGEYEKGLEVDMVLRETCPDDPLVWYNLGCSLALLGREDVALDALDRAIGLGYRDARHMLDDEDLASLRENPRFVELVRRCG